MMTIAKLFTLIVATFAVSTIAKPVIVPISECTTVRSGTLRTADGQKLSITGSSVSFGGNGTLVEFQSCQPNFGRFNGQNGTQIGGHIYVPSLQKCLSFVPGSAIPLPLTTETCAISTDSSQTFSNVVAGSDGNIYFAGSTHADRSIVFFSKVCDMGFFGVDTSIGSDPVSLNCATKEEVVALRISERRR